MIGIFILAPKVCIKIKVKGKLGMKNSKIWLS
jgi:hypothetical protein